MKNLGKLFLDWTPPVVAIAAAVFSSLQWLDAHRQLQQAQEALDQTKKQIALSQRQYEDSIRPLVMFDYEWDAEDSPMGLAIENRGTGPAILKSLTYYVDGRVVSGSEGAVDFARLEPSRIDYLDFDPDDPLGVGEKVWILRRANHVKRDLQADKPFSEFLQTRVAVLVEYCSLSGECHAKCSTGGMCGDAQASR